MTASKLEALFEVQLTGAGIGFKREYPFGECLGRKWRADFLASGRLHYTAEREVLVEIQGTGPQGRHGSYGHHHSDCEKFATAAALGWRVLPLSAKMVRDGSGLKLVEAALGLRALEPYTRKAPRRKKGTLPARVRKAAGLR